MLRECHSMHHHWTRWGSILFLLYPFVFGSTRWHKITKQNESNVIVGFILHCNYCPISNQCFYYYKYLLSTLLQVRMKECHLISMCCGHVVFLFCLIVTCEYVIHALILSLSKTRLLLCNNDSLYWWIVCCCIEWNNRLQFVVVALAWFVASRLFATEIHVTEDPRNDGAMPAKFQICNRDGTLRRNSCLKREQSCSHFQK